MKLGVHIGYWGLGLTADEQLQLVQEAERLGYDSVWTAEAYGSDAATILGWLAQATERIKLGSAIFQMPGRSAAMTAMTAATLDQLSDGRMLLGIGSRGPQVAEGWHGQRFAKQLQRTREYIAVVRMALARERVQFEGETLVLPLPTTRLLRLFPSVYRGEHIHSPSVRTARARSVTLRAPGMTAYADGEPVGPLPVTVKAVSQGLTVLVPPGSAGRG